MAIGAQRAMDAKEMDAWLPALPFAAALWLLVAHLLPLRFTYRPNALGIVSLATLQAYPSHQETIWYALSLAGGGLFALALATAFARLGARTRHRADSHPPSEAGAEATGLVALAGVLVLPSGIAAIGVAACLAGALALGARVDRGTSGRGLPEAALGLPGVGAVAALLLLAALLTPPVWTAAFDVAAGVPDARLVRDNWPFHAELGQHLAWADAMRGGGLQGRDFFSLYGPLYTGTLSATWAVLGRSLAATNLWDAGMHVAGLALVLVVACALVHHRALVLAVPVLVLFANLRLALPIAALLPLLHWHGRRGLAAPALAGAITGAALMFSQEFGIAGLLATAFAFAFLRAGRASVAWAAGASGVVLVVLALFVGHGALAPMLGDLSSYPRWMIAGFGKLPFPSPLAGLPLDLANARTAPALVLRLGLAIAFACAAAVLLVLPREVIAAGRLGEAWRTVGARLGASATCFAALWLGIFGLVSFRSALGRSGLSHLTPLVPVAALLLVLAADRTLAAARARALPWATAATRLAALALIAWAGAFTTFAAPATLVSESLRVVGARLRGAEPAAGDAHVWAVTQRIRALTGPEDAIFVLPNSGAYYYLAERRNPTRFVLSHQMVTNAHRAEALKALRADPPRLVVWDDAGGRVDGIEDARVLGTTLLGWLDAHYELAETVGRVRLLRPRSEAPAGRPVSP